MGTFSKTAIIVLFITYRLRKTKVHYCFRLQQTNGSLPFLFSVFRKQTKVAVLCKFRFPFAEFRKCGDMDMETWTWRHGHGDMDMETWRMETCRHGDIKRKTEKGTLGDFS
jgi:hypothetical protein